METLLHVQVGEWRADRATNELGRAGETLRIEPKAMEVLMALAARAGQVVSREELLAAVWPGVIVGDEALTQSIIKLRRALGDNPRAPTYIETISKRGYRLIAPVRQAGDAPPAPARRRMPSRALAAGALVALVAAAGYVTHLVARPVATRNTVDLMAERQAAYLTLTVLPFESMGDGGEQAYLARGISNDLMTDLSRLPGLRLIAASRAAPDSAAKARYLVSGSVQRESGTLRINIRLIDTASNQQLWSERYERPYGDLFKVQDEITRKLTQVLPGKLSDAVRQSLARRYTRSLEAYDDFLHGQALFLVRRSEDNEEARGYYRKALELDPNFARAYAGLAMTYAMEFRLRPTASSSPALARAAELAETARQIDPGIPEVYWALAFVDAQSRRHRQAIESLQKAIELNPSYADAYAFMGGIYTYIGQPAKSLPLLRTAMRLNPDGGHLYFLLLGRAYLFENDTEQALINLRQASARNPVDLETRLYLAAALAAAGDRSDAQWEAEQIRAVEPGFALRGWLESYPLTSAPERERLQRLLAKAGL
jgi:DNA-binding winged helix-turn-helix (wHTH) protein/TolB-like protein/Tfp pilus assembly protein PilF